MTNKSLPIETAARLLGFRPEEILSVRVSSDGGMSVIAPSGQKLFFPPEVVEQARQKQPRLKRRKEGKI